MQHQTELIIDHNSLEMITYLSWLLVLHLDITHIHPSPTITKTCIFIQMTHAIGDKVQFETYPAPCISLRMKWTALVDDEAWKEYYEAEFGVPGISPSSAQSPMTFHLQFQNQIQRDHICPSPTILSWEWFQDKLWTYCCLWLVIYLKMTHHMTKHDSWHS